MASFKERINQLWEDAKDQDYRTTQEEFACLFGATKNQLKGWLRGSGEPDTELMKRIAQKCNVSVDWLVGYSEYKIATHSDSCFYVEKIRNLPPDIQRAIDAIINSCSPKHNKSSEK